MRTSTKCNPALFRKLFMLLTPFFVFTNFSSAQEKRTDSEVKEVKVYFRGAEVVRTAKVNLPKGTTLLVFENIAEEIETSSIQAAASKGVEVLSVSHSVNYQKEIATNALINRLLDSVKLLNDHVKAIEIQNNVMSVEEAILSANRNAGGTQQGVNTAELTKILELNRKRITEIQTEKYNNTKKGDEFHKTARILHERIRKERERLSNAKGEIRLMVSVANAATASFELKYLARVAGWIPFYDVHTEGPDKPARLVYKAEIAQRTGELWNDVKLTLSSANPQLGINLPDLPSEFVGFNPPPRKISAVYNSDSRIMYQNAPVAEKPPVFRGNKGDDEFFIDGVKVAGKTEIKEEEVSTSHALDANFTANEIVFEFEIPVPYSVPNDGVGRSVSVKDFQLDMKYEYFAIPKLDGSVFLTGIATDWKKLNLLPGYANMFFGNNYTGKLFLNPGAGDDSLRFSFGRDKRILIERKRVSDFSKKSFFGSSKKETYTYEITVNNTQNTDIDVRVIDQLPVSRNAEIKVEAEDLSGGALNAETGRIEWKLVLKANESRKLKLSYSITSPKSKEVYKH